MPACPQCDPSGTETALRRGSGHVSLCPLTGGVTPVFIALTHPAPRAHLFSAPLPITAYSFTGSAHSFMPTRAQ